MKLTFRPIDTWPGELRAAHQRVRSPFSAPWSSTLEILEREVDMLASGGWRHANAVIQLAVPEGAIRQDGLLRAGRKAPEHPGVILTFDGPDGPLRFSCDRFRGGYYGETVDGWQANARAIALGLEALRKVERYGLGSGNEQYLGFQALPPGTPMPAAEMTADEAVKFIIEYARCGFPGSPMSPGDIRGVREDPEFRASMFREAAKLLHPDNGGDPALFRKLTEARDLLDAL